MGSVGLVFGGFLTWLFLTLAEPKAGYPHGPVVYLVSMIGAGLATAVVSMFFWKLTLPGLGGLAGTMLGFYIWLWKDDHVLSNLLARVFVACGVGVVLFVLTYLVEALIVVWSTSFLGGFFVVLGLDVLLHTGLLQGIRALFNVNPYSHIHYHVDNKVYGMLAATLAMMVFSIIWQCIRYRGHRFGMVLVPNV
ncbi:hypothetical protein DM01DRAFT_323380 [Hesseltinella vesiculosa]|uniref:TM7S3/TM198-like domain-containing protein n=1 Tax=Hesseltinella vesiculosa TaxID=101127 RepID=A0A1X2GLP8_9FUNG|nr:hypothetical protein DM01DRAFT_323380 [Hesseltinella vesiculosa]